MAALGENAAGDAAWQRFAMGVASTLLSGGPLRLPDAVGAATASAAGDATWQRFAMGVASTLLSGGPLRLPDAVGVATAPVSCPLAECLGGEPAAEIAVCDPTGEQGCAPEEDAAVSCLSLCRFEGASEAESFREPSVL